MKKIIILILLTLPLTGCVAGAVVAAGAAAGGSAYAVKQDKRSLKTINQDRYDTRIAQMMLDQNKKLKGRAHIAVATFNHIMLMVGQAQTPELRDYAYNLVSRRFKRIQRIYNEVKIEGATSYLQRTNDSWLTTKIRAAMLETKHLHSSNIKVVTESSTVYLLGLVNHQQAKLAIDTARRVAGVKKVVTVFQYLKA